MPAYIPANDLGPLVSELETNIEKLAPRDRGFADSLVRAFDRFGNLSEKQSHWVRVLLGRISGGTPKREVEDLDGAALIAFFDRAVEAGLKYPKVKLTAKGEPVVVSRAGERSKYPGALNVTDGGPFGDNLWYGRINRDGTFFRGGRCLPEVVEVLRALAADPAKTASAYGKRTGSCCFCRRTLEDYRSVSVGYGPVCASKWDLPWGEVVGNPGEYRDPEAILGTENELRGGV